MADVLDRVSTPPIESDFVRQALTRLHNAPLRYFSQEAWDDFASYDGPVVSGDPEGRVPDDLEDDDSD